MLSSVPRVIARSLDRRDNGIRFMRGIVIGCPLSLVFWIAIFWFLSIYSD
jgi:hypothetical protein